jgi:ketosteroid isomerase-like protein
MRKILILLLLIVGCSHEPQLRNYDKTEILNIMKKQEISWSKGDVQSYMDSYWKSDSLRFITKKGVIYGWQNMLEKYKKSYPDKTAMGSLKFEIISMEQIATDKVLVIGKWTLKRSSDELSGFYSLIWKKINGRWQIIIDHTS